MVWQSAGDYLAVRVDRHTKTKKSTYAGFELFRIREKDIPIEVRGGHADGGKRESIVAGCGDVGKHADDRDGVLWGCGMV